jgi:hypothetical protein
MRLIFGQRRIQTGPHSLQQMQLRNKCIPAFVRETIRLSHDSVYKCKQLTVTVWHRNILLI